ncbi:hypothetical protein H4R34_002025 [Dimargaris verticillata]|uniref:Uncharacterized protein n=1 Tax=Dimargaris verticillata TaxID=2761393 RepID=A0A9W8B4Z2_9FUNG|nr:hypothetical protein H4R34_002025 [Dimargaris verticillata]
MADHLLQQLRRHTSCDVADALGTLGVRGHLPDITPRTPAAEDLNTVAVGPAVARGARAVVVDGRIRDVHELQRLILPVFARGISCVGARGALIPQPATGTAPSTVTIQRGENYEPMVVATGDIMVADANGVLCIPRQHLASVVELCQINAPVEEACMRDIRAGHGYRTTLTKYRTK